ncbi:hypothetical protein D3C75_687940 [compost metagenome]
MGRVQGHRGLVQQRLQPAGKGPGGGSAPAVAVDKQLDFRNALLRPVNIFPGWLQGPLGHHLPQVDIAEFVDCIFTVKAFGYQ